MAKVWKRERKGGGKSKILVMYYKPNVCYNKNKYSALVARSECPLIKGWMKRGDIWVKKMWSTKT